jgi:copper homeostasis protein
MKTLLEIACFNYDSAVIASKAGADRIELCVNAQAGGITPDLDLFRKVKASTKIPVYVMIRPRPGNFFYSDEEFSRMQQDILLFRNNNADGFVFGLLTKNSEIDQKRNKELVKLSGSLPCSFHRAFDSIPDAYQGLEIIIDCGFKRLLSSGLKSSALEGVDCLNGLVKRAGNRIIVMPGGGIRSYNIAEIKSRSEANEFHSSGILQNEIADFNEIQTLIQLIK